MAEKVTIMVLKVDLQCSKCYKKVKKILCQFPQIRDQIFDEKSNTVTITVVCCSPEKIRDKLCCKGRGTIKSIDIKEPKKPAPPPPKKDPPKERPVVVQDRPPSPKPPPPPPKADPPPPPPPKADPKPAAPPPKPDPKPPQIGYPPYGCPQFPAYYCLPYYDGPWHQPPPCHCGCGGRSGHQLPPRPPSPCHCGCGGRSGHQQPPRPPSPCHCGCGGRSGHQQPPPPPSPCHCGCGGRSGHQQPPPPPPCHCGCGGRSGRDSYGGSYCSNRCDYFSEENPSSCSVM